MKLLRRSRGSALRIASIVAVTLSLSQAVRISQAEESRETTSDSLPKAGVLHVTIETGDKPIATKSLSRAIAKLESLQKSWERRPETREAVLVRLNVNEAIREYSDVALALKAIKGLDEILQAARKAKIQLGELGQLVDPDQQSQQVDESSETQTKRRQQYQPVHARDGNDGYGVGGGLGGQGGGGSGIAGKQQLLALATNRQRSGGRENQIQMLRKLLIESFQDQQQGESDSPANKKDVGTDYKIGKATLFARMKHRDYQKATFSFEFGLRDDPTYLHANDWDLQYGNGGDHFHVTMVSDDRSRIVDLGEMDWEQVAKKHLVKLPPHPLPRREFVPTAKGHMYLVHTVDRNSDHYALFRVTDVQQAAGTCDIEWRLSDAPK